MTDSRLQTYENLRNEWIGTHAEHSELELLEACRGFAKLTGLKIREQIYIGTIKSLREATNE